MSIWLHKHPTKHPYKSHSQNSTSKRQKRANVKLPKSSVNIRRIRIDFPAFPAPKKTIQSLHGIRISHPIFPDSLAFHTTVASRFWKLHQTESSPGRERESFLATCENQQRETTVCRRDFLSADRISHHPWLIPYPRPRLDNRRLLNFGQLPSYRHC